MTAGRFLVTLAEILRRSAEQGEALSNWHSVISALRLRTAPYLTGAALAAAENLWQQARVTIGETVQRVQAYRRLQAEEQSLRLSALTQALSTAITVPELADLLAGALPSLGITSSYLALYEQPAAPASLARLVGAHDEHGRLSLPAGGRPFEARRLVPDDLLPADRRLSLVVEPLYFRQDHLGFVLFEADARHEELYEILRGQISAALNAPSSTRATSSCTARPTRRAQRPTWPGRRPRKVSGWPKKPTCSRAASWLWSVTSCAPR